MRSGILSFLLNLFFVLEEESNVTSLQNKLQKVNQLLERIEEGSSPCFTSPCQQEKLTLKDAIFSISEKFPKTFLTHRTEGLKATHHFLLHPSSKPKNFFPQSLSEWMEWWHLRYSREKKQQSSWMHLTADVYSLQEHIRYYQKHNDSFLVKKEFLDELWLKRVPYMAHLWMTIYENRLQAHLLDTQGKPKEAEELRSQFPDLLKQIHEIENQFSGNLPETLSQLFPDLSFPQTIAFIHSLDEWMQLLSITSPLDKKLLQTFQWLKKDAKELLEHVQRFNDLEFGVVGLQNFYSNISPLVALEQSEIIQSFLDKVDQRSRSILQLSAFYALYAGGQTLFGDTSVWAYLLPSSASLTLIALDHDFTELLWKSSPITTEIKASLPEWEEKMQKRKKELFRIRKNLIRKRENIMNQMQQQEDPSLTLRMTNSFVILSETKDL